MFKVNNKITRTASLTSLGGGWQFSSVQSPDTVDNTLSIHFGEVQLINKLSKLNITYDSYRVKQFHIVEQPGCW